MASCRLARLAATSSSRWRLMEGLDDISLTLRSSQDIARYEQSRAPWLPVAG